MAPMMGMLPDIKDKAEINQALFIPLQPGRPPGAPALGPGTLAPVTSAVAHGKHELSEPVRLIPPARVQPAQKHEAAATPSPGAAGLVGSANAEAADQGREVDQGRGESAANGTLPAQPVREAALADR